ncbi:MAG: tryptophan--tRNA ligase [Candidatus Diapherotrites archaeon]|nr:tryptophan--tRNA ligase [Candidatus Diapherotrites archaeon]
MVFKVTPWEVKGKVDYNKLINQFGTKPITDDLIEELEKIAGKSHFFLRRKIFFSHRDFDNIIKWYKAGNEFALYTGRGPSGNTHLGHLLPWIFTKYLQDAFDAELYFQLTDDEKFMYNPDLTLEQTHNFAYENALDVIAIGFKPKKTFIFANTDYANTLYKIAIKVAKKTTFSTAKAVFGFTNETNTGMIFFPAMQAAPCFLPTILKGKEVPALIPAAIDQDPYWRGIARAVADKLNYPKPAQIHCMFLPGLGEEGKMSASDPDSAIFTTDSEKDVDKKIAKAFTGGRATVEEQKRKGGIPEVCSIYKYYYFLFEEDDKKLSEIFNNCRSGNLLCKECKAELASRIKRFLKKHQDAREKAKDKLDLFIVKD